MAKRTFQTLVGGRAHTVEVEHSIFSAQRVIRVDGREIPIDPTTQRRVIDKGSVHPFEIAGVPCQVVILQKSARYTYTLVIDGRVHPTGEAPTYPDPNTRSVWWSGALERAPRAFAGVCAALAVALFVAAGVLATSAAMRPARPTVVALDASSRVAPNAWVEVTGLSVDCVTAPFELDHLLYRVAGRDETGALVLLASHPDAACPSDAASGELDDAAGADRPLLVEHFASERIRILWTIAGPTNDMIGVVLCGVLALGMVFLAAFAWVRRAPDAT